MENVIIRCESEAELSAVGIVYLGGGIKINAGQELRLELPVGNTEITLQCRSGHAMRHFIWGNHGKDYKKVLNVPNDQTALLVTAKINPMNNEIEIKELPISEMPAYVFEAQSDAKAKYCSVCGYKALKVHPISKASKEIVCDRCMVIANFISQTKKPELSEFGVKYFIGMMQKGNDRPINNEIRQLLIERREKASDGAKLLIDQQ